ncbi:MAG TPA: hypothetical protein VIX18_11275, partial [Nitrospirota bacterium]
GMVHGKVSLLRSSVKYFDWFVEKKMGKKRSGGEGATVRIVRHEIKQRGVALGPAGLLFRRASDMSGSLTCFCGSALQTL